MRHFVLAFYREHRYLHFYLAAWRRGIGKSLTHCVSRERVTTTSVLPLFW